jgi:serine/threonine protein kinase
MIGQTISHYKILEKLGEGGMGVVYRAEDTKLKRTVALKFLPHGLHANEAERARFLQEAQAASALNHPNICTIHDIAEEGEQQFIVMEFVDGKTLREMIPVQKTRTAIDYAIQIGDALQEAHSKGIVHRDIKTENIMVNSKNQIKVMDFGLAKLKGSLKLTKTSSTVGTLAYMAPEQIQGGDVDARSDIFSFGVVLYETLTGHLPFRGEHEAAMMYSIMNEEPQPLQRYLPDAPSELLHILNRALEKDREERYQTVRDMLIDLRRMKKDSGRGSRQPQFDAPMSGAAASVPFADEKKTRRKRLWVGAAGLAVLCLISILLFVLRKPAARINPNRTSVTIRIPFKEIQGASLSKDGNWLAFPAKNENEKWDIYWMNTASGKPDRLTDENANWIYGADISPDVSQIAYACKSEPNDVYKTKVIASQGGESRTLADTGSYAKWRPDGQRIGYMRAAPPSNGFPSVSGRLEIWSVKPDGTDNRLELIDSVTVRTDAPSFCWSPDGGSIAFVRNYQEGYREVVVRDLATGKERQITSEKNKVDEVIWATNDEILFVSNRSGTSNLWAIPARGGEITQITQGVVPIGGARISGDNKTLIYQQQEWIGHIWISDIDGSNPHAVMTDDVLVQAGGASFSPDGKYISYAVADVDLSNQEAHLFVMDRNGKNRRQLTFGSEKVVGVRWSFDGKWLAYSSRAIGEPEDSSRIYFIQPFNPGPPRLLCSGRQFRWLGGETILVYGGIKTLRYTINADTPTQIFQDSTFAVPIQGSRQLVFTDYRKGRQGRWIVAVDAQGKQKGEPRKIGPSGVPFYMVGAAPDLRFFLYKKPSGNELWRVWTSTGKEERIGKVFPGLVGITDISMNGKEILWLRWSVPSKLVLVKNLFE